MPPQPRQVVPPSPPPPQRPVDLRIGSAVKPPVVTHQIPPRPPDIRPRAVVRNAPSHQWIEPGEVIEIHGRRIRAGLFYFGSGMQAGNGYGPEPSLVEPAAPISEMGAEEAGIGTLYKPTYRNISGLDRAKYLDWLAAGRPPEEMRDIDGLLFLSGLERRYLAGATPTKESLAYA